MKKTGIVLLVALLVLVFAPTALAATPSFDLYFEFDQEAYDVGDTVKAKLILERNDNSDESYKMFVFEDEIIFNTAYLQYVDSSNNANNAEQMVVTSSAVTYNSTHKCVNISYMGLLRQLTRSADLVVAELEFKALANISNGVLYHGLDPQVGLSSTELCAVDSKNGAYIIGDPEAPTYAVKFVAGGGSGSGPSDLSSYAAGDVFRLPAVSYSRDGYTAAGWSDGINTYAAGSVYTMPGHAVNLTAQWVENPSEHTVSYRPNGGDGSAPNSDTRLGGSTFALPNNTFLRNGYDFVGWSDGSYNYAVGYAYTMPNQDISFDAVWVELDALGEPVAEIELIEVGELMPGDEAQVRLPFADVAPSAWYYNDVATAYQQKLIDGMTASTFAPEGNLTIAQAIKLASCMHQKYTQGQVTLVSGGGKWYDTYVAYAIEQNIISGGQFSNYDAVATRTQFAVIFASALPIECYTQINTVNIDAIPDVKSSSNGGDAIYKLYRAGIVTGSDAQHSFLPQTNIRRSEVAAILTRMMNDDSRQVFGL